MAKPGSIALSEDVQKKIKTLNDVDILVGIPSYNNARTIAHVVRAVSAGIAKYFSTAKCILVNSDGGSKDGTPEIVTQTEIENINMILVDHAVPFISKISTPYHGLPGKGSAFRTIFKIAEELHARACCVVDSDLRSITPEWIELLLSPIINKGFDYVAPLYSRHKFDGTITNSIVYPVTRALYGQRIRQPIGGEFGFSGKLASHYLNKDVWETDVARFGIDIWMTTIAICDGFKICQSFLGAKIHDAKDPGADLTSMFTQVISSLFNLMIDYSAIWQQISTSQEVPTFGFKFEVGLEPVPVNVERMVNNFKLGINALTPFIERVLPLDELNELQKLATYDQNNFYFPDELWVKIVYDYATAFYQHLWPADQLMRSMIPLYMGRTASFIIENLASDANQVEKKIENLCQEFERQKLALVQKWSKK